MTRDELIEESEDYLTELCVRTSNRAVGSEGNRKATAFLAGRLGSLGWPVETERFPALDWQEDGADLRCGSETFAVSSSPYSLGCELTAPLIAAATVAELAALDARGKVLLLHGELAREQIMPKGFVFYNPEEHRRIVALLEAGGASALVCATGYNPQTAGGVYPFPLFEDGDFDLPSVFMTEAEGKRLLPLVGREVRIHSRARRIPSWGDNVTACKGAAAERRIVVSAHIDAKKGTPGAIDNATGVIVLLLLAELLRDYAGEDRIELVAFNGEDYYAVPGQMAFLRKNQGRFGTIRLNVNIDGAGYKEGGTYFSPFDLPPEIEAKVREVTRRHALVREGPQWVQGDHSIFVQQGIPAIAVSSQWFIDHLEEQRLTHTAGDHPGIVSCETLVDTAYALAELLGSLGGRGVSGRSI